MDATRSRSFGPRRELIVKSVCPPGQFLNLPKEISLWLSSISSLVRRILVIQKPRSLRGSNPLISFSLPAELPANGNAVAHASCRPVRSLLRCKLLTAVKYRGKTAGSDFWSAKRLGEGDSFALGLIYRSPPSSAMPENAVRCEDCRRAG